MEKTINIDVKKIRNIISYFSDHLETFVDNCECSQKIKDEINATGNVELCTCENNQDHILRDVLYLESKLNQ